MMNKISAFLVLLFFISNNYFIERCLGQACEDYYPCSCSAGLVINCTNVDPERVKQVFERTTNYFLAEVNIVLPPSALIALPSDLLGGKASKLLRVSCSSEISTSSNLVIDPTAVASSRLYSEHFFLSYCNIASLDFAFLRGFERLLGLEFQNCTGMRAVETIPSLPALESLRFSYSVGFSELTSFPAGESFHGLIALEFFSCEDLDVRALNIITNSIARSPARRTLKYLDAMFNPRLTEVPNISPFSRLWRTNLSRNNITSLKTGSITTSSGSYIDISFNPIKESIEPGAIIGGLSPNFRLDMYYNNMTVMRYDAFMALLEPMPYRINFEGGNFFECDCSMAWLFRDNKDYVSPARYANCFDHKSFIWVKTLELHDNC